MTQHHVAQVGGTHYEAEDGLRHWDIIERHDISYLEATATKYVTRWRKKGSPKLDLGKAISYLDRIAQEDRGARRTVPLIEMYQFYKANGTSSEDAMVLDFILGFGTREALREARRRLNLMLEELD